MSADGPVSPPKLPIHFVINGHGAPASDKSTLLDLPAHIDLITPRELSKKFILSIDNTFELERMTTQGKLNHLEGRWWHAYTGTDKTDIPDVALSPWQQDEIYKFAAEILTDQKKWQSIDQREDSLYLEADPEAAIVIRYPDGFKTLAGTDAKAYLEQLKPDCTLAGKPVFFYAEKIGKIKILAPIMLSELLKYFSGQNDKFRFILATCNSGSKDDKVVEINSAMDPIDISQFLASAQKPKAPESPRSKQKKASAKKPKKTEQQLEPFVAESYDYPALFVQCQNPIFINATISSPVDPLVKIEAPVFMPSSSRIQQELHTPTSMLVKGLQHQHLPKQLDNQWVAHVPNDQTLYDSKLDVVSDRTQFMRRILEDSTLLSEIDDQQGLYLERDPDAGLIILKPSGKINFLNPEKTISYIKQLLEDSAIEETAGQCLGFYAPRINYFHLLCDTDLSTLMHVLMRRMKGASFIFANTYQDLDGQCAEYFPHGDLKLQSVLAQKVLEPPVLAQLMACSNSIDILEAIDIQSKENNKEANVPFGPVLRNESTTDFELLIRMLLTRFDASNFNVVVDDKGYVIILIDDTPFVISEILQRAQFSLLDLSLLYQSYRKFLNDHVSFDKPENQGSSSPRQESFKKINSKKKLLRTVDKFALLLYTSDKAIPKYTYPFYRFMNQFLRDPMSMRHYASDRKFIAEVLIHTAFTISAMNKLSDKDYEMSSYRIESKLPSFVVDQRLQSLTNRSPYLAQGTLSSSGHIDGAIDGAVGLQHETLLLLSGRGASIAQYSKFSFEREIVYSPGSSWEIVHSVEHERKTIQVAKQVISSAPEHLDPVGVGPLDFEFLTELDELYQTHRRAIDEQSRALLTALDALRTQVMEGMSDEGALDAKKSHVPVIIDNQLDALKAQSSLAESDLILFTFLTEFKDLNLSYAKYRYIKYWSKVKNAESFDKLHSVVAKRYQHEFNGIGVKAYSLHMYNKGYVTSEEFEFAIEALSKAKQQDYSQLPACEIDLISRQAYRIILEDISDDIRGLIETLKDQDLDRQLTTLQAFVINYPNPMIERILSKKNIAHETIMSIIVKDRTSFEAYNELFCCQEIFKSSLIHLFETASSETFTQLIMLPFDNLRLSVFLEQFYDDDRIMDVLSYLDRERLELFLASRCHLCPVSVPILFSAGTANQASAAASTASAATAATADAPTPTAARLKA